MGIFYSSQSKPEDLQEMEIASPDLPAKSKDDKLERHLSRAVDDVQRLSPRDMEMEFDKIHQRSLAILKSVSRNPCEELTARITQCLEENSNEMSKCFAAMDQYRVCINQQVAEKLLLNVDN